MWTHLFSQGANIGSLLRTAGGALTARGWPSDETIEALGESLPGPTFSTTLAPPSKALVADFCRWSGISIRDLDGALPGWLFPQWGLPWMARGVAMVPVSPISVLNQGCRIRWQRPLPMGEPLQVAARLASVRADERKLRIHTELITGTASAPEALLADMYAVVPRPRKKQPGGAPKKQGPPRARPSVPLEATEVGRLKLRGNAGFEFALLTGDFNPIHWIAPYARMAGFKSTILHGFGMLSKSVGAVVKNRLSGAADRLVEVDVRFVSPLVLPTKTAVYLGAPPESEADTDSAAGDSDSAALTRHSIALGSAPGGTARMLGQITWRN